MILPFPLLNEPLPQPKRWGEPERERLESMLAQPSLFYWQGAQTTGLLTEFRRHYPLPQAFPTSSGSAAIHVAIASMRLQPGEEVIVPAITDMGSVIGILYQQGVPVFADVDPHTYTLDVADVRRRITSKTRAIMPVHLAGNPCDMHAIMQLAKQHNLSVIEDCAQAWGARHQGRPVGLEGDLACFSFNDYKHLSCGDGGIVATKNAMIGAELGKWGDKFYDRVKGGRDPEELAPNYRMSEPQAAVAAAQLTKLPEIAAVRTRAGNRLTTLLQDTPGLHLPKVNAGDTHSYWFYLLRMETDRFACSRDDYAKALASEGVACTAGYIPRAVYRYPVFQTHGFFGGHWPIRDFGLTQMDYRSVSCPVADAILADAVKLTINEAMSDDYVEKIARAVRTVTARLLY
ncbi:glutamine--scyllo-inositol aminotransferase [Nibricoccus aquaticus]|uniref:Glutamine--scyllo-inositol aminotransferase n=1 Tax=Nibricoccus aquaticus TaxID=2576891 RepID=A0A290QEA9_9BACT|nr:DegT/DnrJ/EryC1/StrS family aminotransferase [Nibricoccus aquaticus]ATC64596.1 glutamine--scyllo-inositol aminotransferase [Nibricoccus aquaticus]